MKPHVFFGIVSKVQCKAAKIVPKRLPIVGHIDLPTYFIFGNVMARRRQWPKPALKELSVIISEFVEIKSHVVDYTRELARIKCTNCRSLFNHIFNDVIGNVAVCAPNWAPALLASLDGRLLWRPQL